MTNAYDAPSPGDAELARAIGEAVGDRHGGDGRPSAGQVREIAGLVGESARTAGRKAVTSGRWLAEVTLDAATHLPVRDLATLREHHDGLAGALLARPLVRNASLAAAAVGATTGAIAATPLTWLAAPVELAAETLIVVALEMKLIGELHEAAGYPLAGDLRTSGPLIARAWSETRGLSAGELAGLLQVGSAGALTASASSLLGRSTRDQLTSQIQRRLVRRFGRNTATLAPMMVGAVIGGELNRRATRKLGLAVARTLGIPPP